MGADDLMLDGVAAPGAEARAAAQRAGARAGLAVALVFICGGIASTAVTGTSGSGAMPGVLVLALPALAAGVIGGRVFGPAAWRAAGSAEWLGVVFGLAAATIVLGAAATGVELLVSALFTSNAQLGALERLGSGLVYGLLAVLAGPFILGPVAFPFTATAAVLWSVSMRRLRGRSGA
jgi:hypothetical protein